jgi:hypothetical protein
VREPAEQLGQREAEDQAVEGDEIAEAVDVIPQRARVSEMGGVG